MIDLLPPSVKEQKQFGQLNRRLLRYGLLCVITAGLIALIFAASWLLLDRQEAETQSKLAEAKARNAQYTDIEQRAKLLANRLQSIEQVQKQQTHFTAFLNELAAVTPPGAYIFTLQVSAEANASLNIAAFAESEQAAANFQKAIERSPRFASAALQGVEDDRDPYTGRPSKRLNLTVGLKPGALQ